jgi:hypothetical protein
MTNHLQLYHTIGGNENMNFADFEDLKILDVKDALCDYNKELLEYIEEDKDIFPLIRAFEELNISEHEKFKYAFNYQDIIGPKVYVGDFDISVFMNDYLTKDDNFNVLINPFYERLGYCLDDLSEISKSRDDFAGDVFKKYLSRLNKLYNWNGKDTKAFRAEMKQVSLFKKDCEFRLTYKISSADMKDKIEACRSPQDAFKLLLNTIRDKTINDFNLKSLKEHFEIELPGPKDKISYTYFLEDKLKFDRSSSSEFFAGKENISNLKQLCLYLALYVEIPIFGNIERFLNINGVSLKSPTSFINEYSSVSDKEIKYLLSNGLNKESLLFFLKRFAYTRQAYVKP